MPGENDLSISQYWLVVSVQSYSFHDKRSAWTLASTSYDFVTFIMELSNESWKQNNCLIVSPLNCHNESIHIILFPLFLSDLLACSGRFQHFFLFPFEMPSFIAQYEVWKLYTVPLQSMKVMWFNIVEKVSLTQCLRCLNGNHNQSLG